MDSEPARRDHGIPVVDRLLEPRRLRGLMDRRARVLLAVADGGPAVVLAALDEVELIAAARSHFDDPQALLCVERGREDVAVAAGPDLGPRVRLPDERVVVGHRAVRPDANDLTEMAA